MPSTPRPIDIPQPLDDIALFEQYNLFPPAPAAGDAAGAGDAAPPAPERFRGYDHAVLRYVAYYHCVTVHQLIYRFFLFDGKGPRYGFRLVRTLARRGLLVTRPLDPTEGAVSRHVIEITPAGWAELGRVAPPAIRRNDLDSLRAYWLQFADMMLEREVRGWRLLREGTESAALRAWALRQYRERTLIGTEKAFRERLERLGEFPIELRALGHRHHDGVRLILPVRRGKSFVAKLDALPDLSLFAHFEPIAFEVVSADPDLAQRAEDALRTWSRDTRIQVAIHRSPHFRDRPHPASEPVPDRSLYAHYRVPDPRTLA